VAGAGREGEHQHDAEEKVANQANELDESEPELGLAKGFDTQQLEAEECKLERWSWSANVSRTSLFIMRVANLNSAGN